MSLRHQCIARPLSRNHHNIVYSITTSSIHHHYLVTTSLIRDSYITPSSHHRHNMVIKLSRIVTTVSLHCHILSLQYQCITPSSLHHHIITIFIPCHYTVNTWSLHVCYNVAVTALSHHRHCITGIVLLWCYVQLHFPIFFCLSLHRYYVVTASSPHSSNHPRSVVITSS